MVRGKGLIGCQGRARAGRPRRLAAMRKAREIVAHVEPAQAFGVMGVGLRTIVLGMLEGQDVEVDLLGPAVGLVGHRAAAAPADETPDPGRGGIAGWRLPGGAEGAARPADNKPAESRVGKEL